MYLFYAAGTSGDFSPGGQCRAATATLQPFRGKNLVLADGKLQRRNASFAVINEELEDVGTVHVDEQAACYEIFTSKLRIRVNKSPMSIQIFDKYQKLLFSDYADKGHVSEGTKKVEYKTLRRDEHFFGLGEKTGKMDRRGESYKMWNSDKPCYSVVEDPLYKSIPFFMSSYRYGIFLDNTYKTEFKFGTESRDYYSFEARTGDDLLLHLRQGL